MNTLPRDLYQSILTDLSIEQFRNLTQTDRKFSQISENDQIWSTLLKRDFNLLTNNPKCEYMHYYKLSKMSTYIYTDTDPRVNNFGKSYAINVIDDKDLKKIIYQKFSDNTLPDFLGNYIATMILDRSFQELTEDDKEQIKADEIEGYLFLPGMGISWSTFFSFFTDEELMNSTGNVKLTIQKAIFA